MADDKTKPANPGTPATTQSPATTQAPNANADSTGAPANPTGGNQGDRTTDPSTAKGQAQSTHGAHDDTPGTPNQAPAPDDAPLKDLENSKRPDGERDTAEAAKPTVSEVEESGLQNPTKVLITRGKHKYKENNQGPWLLAKAGQQIVVERSVYDKFRDRMELVKE
jgi:hypothetical protein